MSSLVVESASSVGTQSEGSGDEGLQTAGDLTSSSEATWADDDADHDPSLPLFPVVAGAPVPNVFIGPPGGTPSGEASQDALSVQLGQPSGDLSTKTILKVGDFAVMGSHSGLSAMDAVHVPSGTWLRLPTKGFDFSQSYGSPYGCLLSRAWDVFRIGGMWDEATKSSVLLRLDLRSLHWEKVEAKGDFLPPRLTTTAGWATRDELFFFGGFAHKAPQVRHASYIEDDGVNGLGPDWAYTNHLLVFHVDSGRWTNPRTTGKAPAPRQGHSSVLFPSGQEAAIAGGYRQTGGEVEYLRDVHVLHLPSLAWRRLSTGSFVRHDGQTTARMGALYMASLAALSDGRLAVFGGLDPGGRDLHGEVWVERGSELPRIPAVPESGKGAGRVQWGPDEELLLPCAPPYEPVLLSFRPKPLSLTALAEKALPAQLLDDPAADALLPRSLLPRLLLRHRPKRLLASLANSPQPFQALIHSLP